MNKVVSLSIVVCGLLLGGCSIFRQDPYEVRHVKGTWCALGTSITWYNENVGHAKGRFTRGYQTCVRDVLTFDGYSNGAVNGGAVSTQYRKVRNWKKGADWYTIEHGINDWGTGVKPGTIDDYRNNTSNETFAANYRILIDILRRLNPEAKIILCTPRKGYGFGTYLPKNSSLPKYGNYLKDFARIVREIGAHEGFEVADFYATCGEDDELAALSIDVALHPNDPGFRRMGDELLKAFARAGAR